MSDEAPRSGVAVPIRWHVPEETPTHYATNIVVQSTEHEYVVSFFEAYPPIFFGAPEEVLEKADEIESVTARCVARIIIAADRMPNFVNALQQNMAQRQAISNPEEQEL